MVTDVSVSQRRPPGGPPSSRQWVRRGELLEAARQVFEREGYHGATVSAIVQAAGLSQGAFYLYFPDKKAAFGALQEEVATLLRRRIYWATKEVPDAGARVEAGLLAFFEFYDEYREWMRRLTIEGLAVDEAFERHQRELYDTLAFGFSPTFQELGIPEPELAAHALIGMAMELGYRASFHPTIHRLTNEQLARATAALFLRGAPHATIKGGRP
jgi:AcrR family transcriptional regulator